MLVSSLGAPQRGLGGFQEDVVSILGPFIGTAKVRSFIQSLEMEIRRQAEIGARQAIPDITAEVESTAKTVLTPLVVGAVAAGALGFVMGGIALYSARRR